MRAPAPSAPAPVSAYPRTITFSKPKGATKKPSRLGVKRLRKT